MSAFLCSQDHINALVNYAATPDPVYDSICERFNMTPQKFGEVLYAENIRSLKSRYQSAKGFGTYRFKFTELEEGAHSDVEILKLAHCYDYQACESDDYETTTAHKMIRTIEGKITTSLPGYDAAPWGI